MTNRTDDGVTADELNEILKVVELWMMAIVRETLRINQHESVEDARRRLVEKLTNL